MAHFAQLDGNNVVVNTIVVDNTELLDADGNEDESLGVAFIRSLVIVGADENTVWKQTSYHQNFRQCFAGIGYIYKEDADVFIPPQPFSSWTLGSTEWLPPTPRPDDGQDYVWNEDNLAWELNET